MNVKSDPVFYKTVVCPVCKNSFKTPKIRSKYLSGDSQEQSAGPRVNLWEPLYYYINLCPTCGFAFSEDFTRRILESNREEIQAKLPIPAQMTLPRDFQQAVRLFKLAIYCGELVNERPVVLAGLCQRLAVMYKDTGDIEQEERFLRLALKQFMEAHSHSDYTGVYSEIKLLFVIGELSRRLNYFDQAVKYFSAIVVHGDRAKEPYVVRMAREQWHETVEQRKQSNSTENKKD